MIVQVPPPPTTLDPLTQQKIINDFNRGAQPTFDTGIDFVRIMVIAFAVVAVMLAVVVFVLVSAQWRRARRTGGSPSPAVLSASRQRGAPGPESDAGP